MADPVLDFWFDFASTYSYLAAARIRPLAAEAKVRGALPARSCSARSSRRRAGTPRRSISTRPKAATCGATWSGWPRSSSLPFRRPDPFPQNSLLPARVALFGLAQGWGEDFSVAVYRAQFVRGRPDRRAAHARRNLVAHECRCRPPRSQAAQSDDNKLRLRAQIEAAQRLGVFGAPSFVTATASCSGATTGWSRRSPGPSAARDATVTDRAASAGRRGPCGSWPAAP